MRRARSGTSFNPTSAAWKGRPQGLRKGPPWSKSGQAARDRGDRSRRPEPDRGHAEARATRLRTQLHKQLRPQSPTRNAEKPKTPERLQCVTCGRYVKNEDTAVDQHVMSVFHLRAKYTLVPRPRSAPRRSPPAHLAQLEPRL